MAGDEFKVVRFACGTHDLLIGFPALLVIGHYTHFARLVDGIHPHQAVTLQHFGVINLAFGNGGIGHLALAAIALAVDEEFGFGIVGIDKYGNGVTLVARPGPVGQDVQGVFVLVPDALVEEVAVLGDAGQVDDSEHGAVVGPCIGVVGRGLAQIVETGPNELSHGPFIVIGQGEIHVGHIAPAAIFHIVAAALVVIVESLWLQPDREFIDSA